MKRLFTLCSGLLLIMFSMQSSHALLSYTLTDQLKKTGCAYDDDGDCLDNYREADLAWIVSPHYYYDENEDCADAPYIGRYAAYDRRDYFQVRPMGDNVYNWASSSARKRVRITYFLLHPHDCGGFVSWLPDWGHLGDSEHVRFELYSYDLKRWYLSGASFYHHGRVKWISGDGLQRRANELGTRYASVAADEDSHGSWPGRTASSSDCAASADDFCYGFCDCFKGSMRTAYNYGYWEYLSTNRNVGGPSPESWRRSVLSVSGTQAWTNLNIGWGANSEFWTPRSDAYRKFCGWECPIYYRRSDGHCARSLRGETECTSPLSSKVDTACFRVSGSCSSGGGGGGGGGGSSCSSGQICCEPLPDGSCNICIPSGSYCP